MAKLKHERALASLPILLVGMKGFPIKDLFLPRFGVSRLGIH